MADKPSIAAELLRASHALWRTLTGQARRKGAHHELGERGEAAAAFFLRENGYQILHRGVVLPMGEIDIIAQEPATPSTAHANQPASDAAPKRIIVEVKARIPLPGQPPPERQVDRRKRAKLLAMRAYLCKANHWPATSVRIDIIGVDLIPGFEPIVRHHKNAVR